MSLEENVIFFPQEKLPENQEIVIIFTNVILAIDGQTYYKQYIHPNIYQDEPNSQPGSRERKWDVRTDSAVPYLICSQSVSQFSHVQPGSAPARRTDWVKYSYCLLTDSKEKEEGRKITS